MSIPFGATSLSIPNPSVNISSVRVLNPISLRTHLPLPIFRFSISTLDHHPKQWTIRMGGGPRTFPGGVSKWQWKRMQAKKAKQLLKARLCRERQLYEMRKRAELQAAVSDLERPWEPVARAPALFSVKADDQLKALADRFQRPGGYDLWSDRDGPQLFRTPVDGLPTARFFPKGVVHSIRPYGGRIAGNSEDLNELSPSPSDSAAENETWGSIESGRGGGMRLRRSRRRGGGGGELKAENGDSVPPSYSVDDVRQVHELGDLDCNSGADNGVKGRRGLALYNDRNRRAIAGGNSERESDLYAGVRRHYSRSGSSGSRGGKYGNQQKHGSEKSYGSDSESSASDGKERGRVSPFGRGRYNGSNESSAIDGKERGRVSPFGRGRYNGSNEFSAIDGKERGRVSPFGRGRYNGSIESSSLDGKERGRVAPFGRGRYNGSSESSAIDGKERGKVSPFGRGRYNGSNESSSIDGKERGRVSPFGTGRYNGSNESSSIDGKERGRVSPSGSGRYNGRNSRFGAKRFVNLSQSVESGKISYMGDEKFKSGYHQFDVGNSENFHGLDSE